MFNRHIAQASIHCNLSTYIYSLASFAEESVDDLHGASNAADLVLARGAGLFNLDWEDELFLSEMSVTFLCANHWKELLSDWRNARYWHINRHWQTKGEQCSMPDIFEPVHPAGSRPLVTRGRRYFLSKTQAHAILMEKGFLLHPGLRK